MSALHTTKEGVLVAPGQVWKSLDKRESSRHVRVVSVADGKAVVTNCNPEGRVLGRYTTRLAVRRMHKMSTGWELIGQVAA